MQYFECVRYAEGNILRTHDWNNYSLDMIDPWGPVLHYIACKICSTYHTANKATQG